MSKTKIDWAPMSTVASLLKEFDFYLWFKKAKIIKAREFLEKKAGKRIRPSDFKKSRESCEWWKNQDRPRRKESTVKALDAEGWQRLRDAVREQLVLLQGRTLEEAVAIVSIICPCNETTLDGLNSDLHVWDKPKT